MAVKKVSDGVYQVTLRHRGALLVVNASGAACWASMVRLYDAKRRVALEKEVVALSAFVTLTKG